MSNENALLSQQSVHQVQWYKMYASYDEFVTMLKMSAGIWILLNKLMSPSFELFQLDMYELGT